MSKAAQIVTPTGTPTVQYNWEPEDTAVAGVFEGEFRVTYADDSIESFPNVGFIDIRIAGDVS